MRNYILTGALVAVGLPLCALPLSAASARPMSGYIVRTTVMHAGPDYDYPSVQRLRRNTMVTVHGCLRDWNWCDVSNRYDRGWVTRRDIEVSYQGRRRGITAYLGLGILSFSFGNYWDSYYRSRPFYAQRPQWQQHYTNSYQPSWGPRPTVPNVAPQQGQPGWGGGRGGRPQGQAMPPRPYVPTAPQVAPQHQPGMGGTRGGRPQGQAVPQVTPQPQQARPEVRGNAGQHQTPGNGQGGQRGNSGDKSNNDRKSRD